MEILLKAGDKINIPAGCKVTIVDNEIIIENDFQRRNILASTKNNCLVISWKDKEEEKPNKPTDNYKDGDILCNEDQSIFVVFKSYEEDNNNTTFQSHYNTVGRGDYRWLPQSFHVASIREQQLFFQKLKEKGLIWNANTRRVHIF